MAADAMGTSISASTLYGSYSSNILKKENGDTVYLDKDGKERKFSDVSTSTVEKQKEKEEETKAQTRKKGYDKDTFLKLFVAQLKYQDPMEPMKNEQYMTQMSQFTSTEQITNMASSFEKFTKVFEEKGSFNKKIDDFLKEFQNTNKALLDRIASLENEIKKLKA